MSIIILYHFNLILIDYFHQQYSYLKDIIFFFLFDMIIIFLVVIFFDIVLYDLWTLSVLLLVIIVDINIGIGFVLCLMVGRVG